MTEKEIRNVNEIYSNTLTSLDQILVGQNNAKTIITASILCDPNSKVLLTGGTGYGKTSIANSLAKSFNSARLTMTSDMIPSDIQNQLKDKTNIEFLEIDEFNRASGKTLSALLELMAEKQMTIDGTTRNFGDFYVFATQNDADISGIFNVSQANYDRFDINVPFDNLSEDDKRAILFSDFEPSQKSFITKKDIITTTTAVKDFKTDAEDQRIMMESFKIIDGMFLDGKPVFSGSNIRAHRFALKLAKLIAMYNMRGYILPADIAVIVKYVYGHRTDQNLTRRNLYAINNLFNNAEEQIMSLKRNR